MNESVNKDRVRLWAQALRNPDLIQGRMRLASRATDEGDDPWQQCCLDVACRVAMDNGLELQEQIAADRVSYGYQRGYRDARHSGEDCFNHPFHYTALPDVVASWYGFDTHDVLMGKEGARFTAIDLNDGRGLPFSTIADIIEAEFLTEQREGEETS